MTTDPQAAIATLREMSTWPDLTIEQLRAACLIGAAAIRFMEAQGRVAFTAMENRLAHRAPIADIEHANATSATLEAAEAEEDAAHDAYASALRGDFS